jgi:hypothetical protein
MALYHSIVKCSGCLSNNHFYSKAIYEKINAIEQKIIFDCPDVVKCRYCQEYLKFTKKYIVMNENKIKQHKKMKLNEPEYKYVKSEDIGTGNGANGILTCEGEGEIVQGRYGDRLELPVSVGGLDKIWSISPMNQKLLMGMLGDDTTLWIGKEIHVFLAPSATAKSGFYIGVKE